MSGETARAITTGDYGHIFDIVTITALAVTVILAQRGRS
jgi:hypothetical protein